MEQDNIQQTLWNDFIQDFKNIHNQEYIERCLVFKEYEMIFTVKKVGKKQEKGYPVYISLHGGGGCAKQTNDVQYQNQQNLYNLPDNCVYITPRGPTDTWNLWHQEHIQVFMRRLILLSYINDEIDLNRVYLIGYSAGGDGVYQMAPRLADYLAGACMMAGHPNDASPLNLINLPFSIHCGENDHAYNRSAVAYQYGQKLLNLQQQNTNTYVHQCHIVKDKAHWMDREDQQALYWVYQFKRNPYPKSVVWHFNRDSRNSFFNIFQAPLSDSILNNHQIHLLSNYKQDPDIVIRVDIIDNNIIVNDHQLPPIQFYIYLNQHILDLNLEVVLKGNSGIIYFTGKIQNDYNCIIESIYEKCDPYMIYTAKILFKKEN